MFKSNIFQILEYINQHLPLLIMQNSEKILCSAIQFKQIKKELFLTGYSYYEIIKQIKILTGKTNNEIG